MAGYGDFDYPTVEVVLQPPNKYAFRYRSENRHNGTITIQIRVNGGYEGPVVAFLGCVTANDPNNPDDPPMPHPNEVLCPEYRGCTDGVCKINMDITKDKNIIEFSQIGILRVKTSDVSQALQKRTSNIFYPFVRIRGHNNGAGESRPKPDLTRVRFACQVLIQDARGQLRMPLAPVVTSLVTHYPEKLKIVSASHDSGLACGGLQVFLFTDKLATSVDVVFREEHSEWHALAAAVEQHHRVALRFTTPPYRDKYYYKPVQVYYFMKRTVDDDNEQLSNRRDFTYLPISDETVRKEKVSKPLNSLAQRILHGVRTVQNPGGNDDGAGCSTARVAFPAVVVPEPPVAEQRQDYNQIPENLADYVEPPVAEQRQNNNQIPENLADYVEPPVAEQHQDNNQIPENLADYVFQDGSPAEAMEINEFAVHYLEQPFTLREPMEIDDDLNDLIQDLLKTNQQANTTG